MEIHPNPKPPEFFLAESPCRSEIQAYSVHGAFLTRLLKHLTVDNHSKTVQNTA